MQYGVLVAAVVAIALVADWHQLRMAFFDVEVAKALFPEIITTALVNTVLYTLLGFGFGLALGLVLALMRLSSGAALPLDRRSPTSSSSAGSPPCWCSSRSASVCRWPSRSRSI